jgi:hypothetical protein
MVMAVISIVLGAIFHEQDEDEDGLTLPGYVDGIAILVTVVIVACLHNFFFLIMSFFNCGVVSTFNNWSQEQQFQKLNKRQKDRLCYVIRDGRPEHISIMELVVGDIFRVETGEILPCDGLVTEANSIGVCMGICLCACVCVCVCVYVYMFVCVCICLCVCVWVYVYVCVDRWGWVGGWKCVGTRKKESMEGPSGLCVCTEILFLTFFFYTCFFHLLFYFYFYFFIFLFFYFFIFLLFFYYRM